MTHYEVPSSSTNNKTYDIDVDDVAIVPHCTEILTQTESKGNLYATPGQAEPVYESPLNLVEEIDANSTETRKSAEKRGRRSRTNDIYEATNDETLLNGRCYTGYSYVTKTENVIPRMRFAYDNPVGAMEEGNEFEESSRNSRFSTNIAYEDTDRSKTLTIQGIRDIKTGSSNKHSHGDKSSGKHRTSLLQILTLLWSILACLIAVIALLVASGKIKMNDVPNETHVKAGALESSQERGNQEDLRGNYTRMKGQVESSKENYIDLETKYNTMTKQVESFKQNYTELQTKYNTMTKQVESSKQNYTELLAKYNIMTHQVESSKQNYTELQTQYNIMTKQLNGLIQKLKRVETINSSLTTQLRRVDSDVHSLGDKLEKVNSEVAGVTNANQELNNTIKSINSKFSVQLKNISKQVGPRGFNGSQGLQGPQGPQGIGNISACIQHYDTGTGPILKSSGIVSVRYKQRTGWKVMSAVCTTERNKGAVQTVLSVDRDTYICTCVDPSTTPPFTAALELGSSNKYIVACTIIYWECPILT